MKNHDAELNYGDPVCACCGSQLPESAAVIGGDLLCDECQIALAEPKTVAALLTIGLSTTGRWG